MVEFVNWSTCIYIQTGYFFYCLFINDQVLDSLLKRILLSVLKICNTIHVMTPYKNRLAGTILVIGHNICFLLEIIGYNVSELASERLIKWSFATADRKWDF